MLGVEGKMSYLRVISEPCICPSICIGTLLGYLLQWLNHDNTLKITMFVKGPILQVSKRLEVQSHQ
jgi:hypothetical protein